MTKFGDWAYRVNPECSALDRYIDICNLFFKSNSLTWCIFMIIPPRWVTLMMHDIVILPFLWYYHGLFASTFKILTGLPLVMLFTRHGGTGVWRWVSLRRCPYELGRFSVRMHVGVGWWHGHPLSPKISAASCISMIWPSRPYLVNLTIW